MADDLARAADAARRCDLLLAVGSTLAVYPVADMVPVARMGGALVVIVNGGETAMDHLADALLRGSISEVLRRTWWEALCDLAHAHSGYDVLRRWLRCWRLRGAAIRYPAAPPRSGSG